MRRAVVLFGAALVLCAAARASAGYVRYVEVAEPGWIRLALDARSLAQGLPGDRFRVRSPDGEVVPHRLLGPRDGFVRARTVSLDEDASGWSIVFDLGPTPVSHRRLEVDLIRRTSARDCRLEGSQDLVTWSFLGEATLFRLGEDGHLHGSALDYTRTDARYLKLRWPRAAGFPEIRDVGVRPLPHPPGDPVVDSFALHAEDAAPGVSGYRIELPGDGLRLRTVGFPPDRRFDCGYRLYRGASQRWDVIAHGVFRPDEPPRIDVARAPERSRLRLEIYGDVLLLESVSVEVAPMWILFLAETEGTYGLDYGEGVVASQPGIPDLAVVGPVTDIGFDPLTAGLEARLPPKEIPSREVRPVGSTDSEIARTRWTILPGDARPGRVVRLTIPDEVRREVGSPIGRLRVLAGDREVPYVSWIPEVPEAVFELRGVRPTPVEGERYHRVRIEREEIEPLLTQIEIFVETGDLEPRVGLSFPRDERPGVETRPVVVWSRWECGETGVLPCRAVFDGAPAEASGVVDLLVETRRDDPEPSVTVRGWTARPTLVFVLPETDDLSLARLHGRRVRTASYDLDRYASAFLAAPWTPISLDLASERDARERREKFMRIALFAVLAVGAVALLWILARNLRGGGGTGPGRD